MIFLKVKIASKRNLASLHIDTQHVVTWKPECWEITHTHLNPAMCLPTFVSSLQKDRTGIFREMFSDSELYHWGMALSAVLFCFEVCCFLSSALVLEEFLETLVGGKGDWMKISRSCWVGYLTLKNHTFLNQKPMTTLACNRQQAEY